MHSKPGLLSQQYNSVTLWRDVTAEVTQQGMASSKRTEQTKKALSSWCVHMTEAGSQEGSEMQMNGKANVGKAELLML